MQMPDIKKEYKKYLHNIQDNYNCGEDGKFPPEVNPERLLEFSEYVEWWKAKQFRIGELKRMLERHRG
jgi:hypothetical protein